MYKLLLFFFLLPSMVHAQVNLDEFLDKYSDLCPGAVNLVINDSVIIDETEITHLEWMLSVHSQSFSRRYYKSLLPDTVCWMNNGSTNIELTKHYLRYPGFRYYPMVGVSYDQAVNYCKWRSKVVNHYLPIRKEKYKKLRDYTIEIEYRLPTKEEWEIAASSGLDLKQFPHGVRRPYDPDFISKETNRKKKKSKAKWYKDQINKIEEASNKDLFLSKELIPMEFNVYENYYSPDMQAYRLEFQKEGMNSHTTWVYESNPNKYGIYQMIGNVSELTVERGVAKGGSYKDKINDFTIKTDFKYTKPSESIGFRCVGVLKVYKKGEKAPPVNIPLKKQITLDLNYELVNNYLTKVESEEKEYSVIRKLGHDELNKYSDGITSSVVNDSSSLLKQKARLMLEAYSKANKLFPTEWIPKSDLEELKRERIALSVDTLSVSQLLAMNVQEWVEIKIDLLKLEMNYELVHNYLRLIETDKASDSYLQKIDPSIRILYTNNLLIQYYKESYEKALYNLETFRKENSHYGDLREKFPTVYPKLVRENRIAHRDYWVSSIRYFLEDYYLKGKLFPEHWIPTHEKNKLMNESYYLELGEQLRELERQSSLF